LDWSRLHNGLISFKPKPFLLENGIVPVLDCITEAANQKTIGVSCDFPKDLSVVADAKMFESLMRNLVFNAVKFTPHNGNIRIEAKPVLGNSVQISVSDTGIGMDQNMIRNLFCLPNQTNRAGTNGESGTGLGLMICKDFIEKHGGKIWAESEEGKGSTFYFTISGN
jgi:signal transduction histidine kinase